MKLERLRLTNFRGFEQVEIEFEPDVTVIAGVNGVGKTGLLHAVATLLSRGLPEISLSNERVLPLSNSDVQYGKDGLVISATIAALTDQVHVDINRAADLDDRDDDKFIKHINDLENRASQVGKKDPQYKKYREELRYMRQRLKDPKDLPTIRFESRSTGDNENKAYQTYSNQPICVLYSANRLFKQLPRKLPRAEAQETALAFRGALKGAEVSLSIFAHWFLALKSGLVKNTKLASNYIEHLKSLIAAFLPGFSDLEFESHPRPRFKIRKNDSYLDLGQLSDGEQGLLALLFDITRRLTLANPASDDPITEGLAVVLIDEIELHLHPRWQRQVLRKLCHEFKNCQFIITTHSPQVIGQVKAEKLRVLDEGDNHHIRVIGVEQSFGMDSSWILLNIMGTPSRDIETETELSDIYDLIYDEQYIKARDQANIIRKKLGDFPELDDIFTLLDRYRLLEGI